MWKGKKAGVLGLGKSGQAVALLLHACGIEVLISEETIVRSTVGKSLPPDIKIETGGHTAALFECDFWVKSPGISPRTPILIEGHKRKIPVYSELETAVAFLPKGVRLFAVSGTNGKTTTTSLLGEILKTQNAGTDHHVWVCGNIGNPVSLCVGKVAPGDDVVIEVSSYQLEDSTYFRPQFACLLNITPDHLEHHGGMRNYIKAKGKIFKNQRANDVFVVNGADVTKEISFASDITEWDFSDAAFAAKFANATEGTYNGLSWTNGRSHNGVYLYSGAGKISVPVKGDCQIQVTGNYQYSYYYWQSNHRY